MNGYEYLLKFLNDNNFRYETHEALILFKIEGTPFFAFKSETHFVQILVSCKAPERDRATLLNLCNTMNDMKYCTKYCLSDDNERITCNHEFMPTANMDTEDWLFIFHLLDRNSDALLEEMNKI